MKYGGWWINGDDGGGNIGRVWVTWLICRYKNILNDFRSWTTKLSLLVIIGRLWFAIYNGHRFVVVVVFVVDGINDYVGDFVIDINVAVIVVVITMVF